MKKVNLLPVTIIMFLVGLFFLFFSIKMFQRALALQSDGVLHKAMVLEPNLRKNGYLVSYAFQNIRHSSRLRDCSDCEVGKEIDIRINPVTGDFVQDAPNSFWLKPIIVGCFGAILLFLVYLIYKNYQSEKNRITLLRTRGMMINATIVKFEDDKRVRVKGKNQLRILLEWEDENGKIWSFKSEAVWITETDLKTIPVYVDAQNHKNFYVDLEAVLKRIP